MIKIIIEIAYQIMKVIDFNNLKEVLIIFFKCNKNNYQLEAQDSKIFRSKRIYLKMIKIKMLIKFV